MERAVVLPEVELAQAEAGSGVRDLYRPVHHLHLTLLHRTRRPSLPTNHKLTRCLVDSSHTDTNRQM